MEDVTVFVPAGSPSWNNDKKNGASGSSSWNYCAVYDGHGGALR
jgi:serine/threonine protein phosphatase PrpC